MFAAQLLFQLLDAFLFCSLQVVVVAGKCRCTIYKELLLPCVKDLWLKLVLVA